MSPLRLSLLPLVEASFAGLNGVGVTLVTSESTAVKARAAVDVKRFTFNKASTPRRKPRQALCNVGAEQKGQNLRLPIMFRHSISPDN